METIKTKEIISQAPSEGMRDFIIDIIKDVGISSPPEKIYLDKNYVMVEVKIDFPLDGSVSQDELKFLMKKKFGNYVYLSGVDASNTKEVLTIILKGYSDTFYPDKFYKFIKMLVKKSVYDSHKMDTTSEAVDKIKVNLAHSYTMNFEETVNKIMKSTLDKLKTIKQYHVLQHPNYKDNFEVIVEGVKTDAT